MIEVLLRMSREIDRHHYFKSGIFHKKLEWPDSHQICYSLMISKKCE